MVTLGPVNSRNPPWPLWIWAPAWTSTAPSVTGSLLVASMAWAEKVKAEGLSVAEAWSAKPSRPNCRNSALRWAMVSGVPLAGSRARPISRLVTPSELTFTWLVPPNRMPFWFSTSTVPSALIDPRIWLGAGASIGLRRPVLGSSWPTTRFSTTQLVWPTPFCF